MQSAWTGWAMTCCPTAHSEEVRGGGTDPKDTTQSLARTPTLGWIGGLRCPRGFLLAYSSLAGAALWGSPANTSVKT
ncbi:MAG: hypothetical protein M2R45_03510 [Verrucomicrobia subdivision 3 bacterium]|nr:hypothetical protein [Limisphaerales bacterium]MCS1415906.1 hypothetical protein [Limisphaerales bacterium]